MEGTSPGQAQETGATAGQANNDEPEKLRQAAEALNAAGNAVYAVAKVDRVKAEPPLAQELAVLAEEARDVEGRVMAAARRLEDIPDPVDDDSISSRVSDAIAALKGEK